MGSSCVAFGAIVFSLLDRVLALVAFAIFAAMTLAFAAQAHASVPAQTVMLTDRDIEVVLSGRMVHVPEAQVYESLESFLAATPQKDWVRTEGKVANMGYTATPHWFAVDLKQTEQAGDWYLTISYPVLDYIDLYVVGENQTHQVKLGDRLAFDQRPIDHNWFVVPLQLEVGETVRVLIRIETESSLQLPLSLWRQIPFHERTATINLAQGIYYGFMIVMALYNLFLYFFIREKRYALYVGFIVSFVLFQISFSGYGYQYLWPNTPAWNDIALPFFLSFVLLFLALFVREFLELPAHNPVAARFYEFCAISVFLIGMCSSLLSITTATVGLVAFSLPMTAYAIILGITRWSEGVTAAKYFTIAWLMTLTGAICLALNKLDILPRNLFTENSLQFGTAIEVVLISFALGAYINQQRDAKFAAQAETLRMETLARQTKEEALAKQQELTANLELRVQERTQDLQAAMAELSLVNQRFKEMSQIDELTQLYNRRYFNSSYLTEYERSVRTGEPLSLILVDVDFFKKVNDTYGHLVGDDCLVYLANVLKQFARRPADVVARFGGEEFILMLPNTDEDGAYQIAETLRIEVARGSVKVPDADTEIHIAVSAGYVTVVARQTITPEAVIAAADEALYAAKANGRNQVRQGSLTS